MYTGSASNSLASKKEAPLEMDDCTNELHNHIQQIVV
jgi:hypothetical protein